MPGDKHSIKMLNYNISGLDSKLSDSDLISFLVEYDFICLTETFLERPKYSETFKDFHVFHAPAKKLSYHGRMSGGVSVFVKACYLDYIEQLKIDIDNCIALKVHKSIFGTEKDILLVGIYIPPYNSNYWNHTLDGYGVELLDKCIFEANSFCPNLSVLCFGDFNARTANGNGEYENDNDLDCQRNDFVAEVFRRTSQDLETNQFGDQLLEFCNIHDCLILNGLQKWNFDDSFTYICSRGCSVIDYFVMSFDLLHLLDTSSLCIKENVDSDHVPVELKINIVNGVNQVKIQKQIQDDRHIDRIIWQSEKENEYKEKLQDTDTKEKLKESKLLIDDNINEAIQVFNDSLKTAAQCMVKKIRIQKQHKQSIWYDGECRQMKKECKKRLRHFRKERNEELRKQYVEKRSGYKQLLKRKKFEYQMNKADKLSKSTNSSEFWTELKELGGTKKSVVSDKISLNQWHEHFKNVFNYDNEVMAENVFVNEYDNVQNNEHALNKPITLDEVKTAIKKLNNHKAGGLDGVLPEMLKNGGDEVALFLTKLFNKVFDSGTYPTEWAKAIIIPIFKKGDVDQPDNYRGISLINTSCKCFTLILNKRLYEWLEENSLIVENQAGFRRKYSTLDQIFTLHSAIQKCLNKKKQKVYVAFVDFRKAFDTVNHERLLQTIKDLGINGKFYNTVKSMYDSLVSCVRINNDLSEFFECPVGVRQGCVLSPTLFSLFINQLANQVNDLGEHGIQMLPNILELFLLLFADDIALISNSPGGLQSQLNILKNCCDRLMLTVNKTKTKIMVFRKGGFLSQAEKWYYDGELLEVVNKYTYLGFTFTTMLSFNLGTAELVTKAKRALQILFKAFQACKGMTQATFFRIFDSKVQSILFYSSELWGFQRLDNLEKVHLLACKRFLGVPLKTPNKIVYGELGRYPIYISTSIRCIKYWFKILKMPDHRLPKQAYKMMLTQDDNGKKCWVSHIKELLSKAGFYYVWVNQGTVNINAFIKKIKQRLIDQFRQEWIAAIRDKERYALYRNIKVTFSPAEYINFINIYCFTESRQSHPRGVDDK